MTAPQPSTPEDCAAGIVVHLAAVAIAMRSPEQGTYADAMKVIIRDAIAARDAALLAPLREEVERLTDRLRDALDRGNRWEKYAHEEETRCSKLAAALRPFAAIQPTDTMPDGDKFVVVWDGSLLWADVDPKLVGAWSGVTAADLRAAARALAEGQP